MKAIILAAGQGTRLGNLTKDIPKGMLQIHGKTILEHQIELFKSVGIDDVIIVRGFCKDRIDYKNIQYVDNDLYESTNMIESLMCAKKHFNDECIISYSDILFSKKLLETLVSNSNDIVVSIDTNWKEYWIKRYGKDDFDIENLRVDNNSIVEIGQEITTSKEIQYRYIGLNKFTTTGFEWIVKTYNEKKNKNTKWKSSNKEFLQGFVTDILQELIDLGYKVTPSFFHNDWLEIDSKEDYKLAEKIFNNNFKL
tara:strand:+ start:24 stop:782 length:759 start_codon:yes stop_codon:yes gene_type:complete